jgi:hypothetical protein
MPFDHAATFELKGVPGNIIQDVINISSDGTFVAVAIGYGFEEDRGRAADLQNMPASPNDFLLGGIKLSQVPIAALIEGFRLNPKFERLTLSDQETNGRSAGARERTLSTVRIPNTFANKIIEQVKPREEISFLFSILDSATGRELQDEPIHNLASLGSSDGARPFRRLAQPLTFQPRSTIRLQIIERSENVRGTLFVVLYGYKTVGGPILSQSISPQAAQVAAADSTRVIPFDYVASFDLVGSPGNYLEQEIAINVEGGFVTTEIGYGLAVKTQDVKLKEDKATVDPSDPEGKRKLIKLTDLEFNHFAPSALQDGIRVRPNFLRVALQDAELIDFPIRLDLANRVFERLNRPEDVSFRYSLFDTGTGRELQNQPIHNIAGLGIANGERPFKRLARPMLFLPRSTIRVAVEERVGRGRLFIVFQGYKLLGRTAAAEVPIQARGLRRR